VGAGSTNQCAARKVCRLAAAEVARFGHDLLAAEPALHQHGAAPGEATFVGELVLGGTTDADPQLEKVAGGPEFEVESPL
jgi:hypothetical protein